MKNYKIILFLSLLILILIKFITYNNDVVEDFLYLKKEKNIKNNKKNIAKDSNINAGSKNEYIKNKCKRSSKNILKSNNKNYLQEDEFVYEIDSNCNVLNIFNKIHINGKAIDVDGQPVFPGHIVSIGGGFFDENGEYDSYTIDINSIKAVYFKNNKICKMSYFNKISKIINFKCSYNDFEELTEEDMEEIETISIMQYICDSIYKDDSSIKKCKFISKTYENILE